MFGICFLLYFMKISAPKGIYIYLDNGKKQMKLGAVPTINLPIKSHEREKTAERRHINIVKDTVPSSKHKDAYKNIDHFAKSVSKLKSYGWVVTIDINYYFK